MAAPKTPSLDTGDLDLSIRDEDRLDRFTRRPPKKQSFVIETPDTKKTKPTVHTIKPTIPQQPPKSSQMESVDLPSLFAFYPFRTLFVRRFSVQDLLKIYEARAKRRFRYLVEAISSTLHNVSAFDLTLEDFWYLMYWHRINSYRKTPYLLDWYCSNEEHVKRIENKELEPDTLKNQLMISRSTITVDNLNVDRVMEKVKQIKDEYGISVCPTMMDGYVEFIEEVEENENKPEEEKLPEFVGMLNRYALLISKEHGATLAERREVLAALNDPEFFVDMEDFIALLNYGVREKFKVKCKGCGAETEIESSIDALSFLPHLQRAVDLRS